MESRVDRADRDVQDLGDPLGGDVGVVMQDEHGPVVDRQASDGRLELVPVDDGVDPSGRRRLVSRQDSQVRRPLAGPTPLRVASANEESVRPGVKARRVAKLRQVSPDRDQRLLLASSARSRSRRILRDTARNLVARSAATSPKASLSPCWARFTSSVSTPLIRNVATVASDAFVGYGSATRGGLQSSIAPLRIRSPLRTLLVVATVVVTEPLLPGGRLSQPGSKDPIELCGGRRADLDGAFASWCSRSSAKGRGGGWPPSPTAATSTAATTTTSRSVARSADRAIRPESGLSRQPPRRGPCHSHRGLREGDLGGRQRAPKTEYLGFYRGHNCPKSVRSIRASDRRWARPRGRART